MDFRRSGQLDERRRRVLRDELAQPADNETAESGSSGSASAKGPVRAYSPAVLTDRQPRVADLLPVRPFLAVSLVLLLLTAVAAIECLHIYVRTSPIGSHRYLAAFDISARGSLGSWFAAMLFAGGVGLAITTLGIRAHRVDDYQGRYRIWLWIAAALVWASIDAATGVHQALGLLIATATHGSVPRENLEAACTISWVVPYGLVFGALAIRLAIEVWSSLTSFAALSIAGLFYVLSMLATLEMLPQAGPLVDSVIGSSLVLLAHVAAVSAIALYARHVYLDAGGRLKVHIDPDKKKPAKKSRAKLKVVKAEREESEERRPAKSTTAAEKSSGEKSSGDKTSSDKTSSKPTLTFGASSGSGKATATIAKSAAASTADDEDEDDEDGDSSLSRSERRRLKKLARREGTRRAA
jgi:hypothetical protein